MKVRIIYIGHFFKINLKAGVRETGRDGRVKSHKRWWALGNRVVMDVEHVYGLEGTKAMWSTEIERGHSHEPTISQASLPQGQTMAPSRSLLGPLARYDQTGTHPNHHLPGLPFMIERSFNRILLTYHLHCMEGESERGIMTCSIYLK